MPDAKDKQSDEAPTESKAKTPAWTGLAQDYVAAFEKGEARGELLADLTKAVGDADPSELLEIMGPGAYNDFLNGGKDTA